MSRPQYAILRFAKYKGRRSGTLKPTTSAPKRNTPAIPMWTSAGASTIPSDRTERKISCGSGAADQRSRLPYPVRQCSSRGSPGNCHTGVFQGKKKSEIRAYFQEALAFIQQNQDPKTIVSAVVHMDEKTPHMHLCFVPLTEDGRLSAKDIMGNKKKLTWWRMSFGNTWSRSFQIWSVARAPA